LDIWYAAEVFIQCIRGERKTTDTSPRGFKKVWAKYSCKG
jgi:hypothetical protein